jgi:methylthioribose-1-phosphate isomerase
VRGAPAIGVAAAYAVAVAARSGRDELDRACPGLVAARPTAVNLPWAVGRMREVADGATDDDLVARLDQAAIALHAEEVERCHLIGDHGASLIPDGGAVLTHCNAGALATCGYGTALGVIRAAVESGRKIDVYADETRPFLQGARLTAWEMMKDGIPTTVICDNMAASLMRAGKLQAIVVGADRIAANGDVANKIGTYGVAVLAKEHGIPFYVAAPWSTIDLATKTGADIPIEQRSPNEVTHHAGKQLTPNHVGVWNPAFDITPAKYVTAIITERGVLRAPYPESLERLSHEAAVPA